MRLSKKEETFKFPLFFDVRFLIRQAIDLCLLRLDENIITAKACCSFYQRQKFLTKRGVGSEFAGVVKSYGC